MIRFYNGRVLEGLAVTENEVWIDGDAIAYVGPAREETPAFDREIDLNGDLLAVEFKDDADANACGDGSGAFFAIVFDGCTL